MGWLSEYDVRELSCCLSFFFQPPYTLKMFRLPYVFLFIHKIINFLDKLDREEKNICSQPRKALILKTVDSSTHSQNHCLGFVLKPSQNRRFVTEILRLLKVRAMLLKVA